MTMDPRKQRVLQAIVALYAMEGEPVGSGLLSNYLDLSVSSATLRNEMAALTKLGLLEQPHTSAGRVPSTKGYRYYLDNLLDADEQLPAAERQAIDDIFDDLDYEPEHLAQGAARALSRHTGFTAAVTTPRADDLCIAHFEVVQVGRYSAAVLGVTSAGGVCTRVARVAEGLTRQQAANVAAVLNQNLTFVSPADLTPCCGKRCCPRRIWRASRPCWNGRSWPPRWASCCKPLTMANAPASCFRPPNGAQW